MKSLNEKDWKFFRVFDNGFFEIRPSSSHIDSSSLIEGSDKVIPYVTRSGINNGIASFVSDENTVFGLNHGNCITVGLDTQTVFWQPYEFITGQNIHVVTGHKLDKDSGLFLVVLLRKQLRSKFNWGGNGATLGRARKLRLSLPVDDNGNLDFDYMAEYTHVFREFFLNRYRELIAVRIAEMGNPGDVADLDEKDWGLFQFSEIFDIRTGFYNKRPDSSGDGKIPFIGAVDSGNGVVSFLTLDEVEKSARTSRGRNDFLSRKLFPGHALVVTNNGSIGHAYYHEIEFTCSQDVNSLYLLDHEMSRYEAMFFCAMVENQGDLFDYSRKWGLFRMRKSKILLPIDDNGEPDYVYIEQYIKIKMLRMYKKYFDYIGYSNAQ